ncbi:MAG: FAD-dependent monooxygenase [Pseudomonadota bacterium]
MNVLLVGAGLGGLTLGIALCRTGHQVHIIEQAAALGEVGAGVQISANGSRVLHGLGLAGGLDAICFRPECGEMRHWRSGELLITRPLGSVSIERYGFPYYHLHRADFHRVLVDAFRAAGGIVSLNSKLVDIEMDGASVSATIADGTRHVGDVLIGCDGIHSTVRQWLHGEDSPRFTGCVAWRATVPTEDLPDGHVRPVASNWLGQGGHFVHYFLRAGALVNCVGVIERDDWVDESWSAEGTTAAFAEDFAGWHDDLQLLIRTAERCYRWGLFDRAPLPWWSRGRVSLLGDACHPMLPFMAQGAVMAIEDAYTAAKCLNDIDDTHNALQRYQALRLERTSLVQQMSRDNISLFHNPDVDDLEAKLNQHRERHHWLYGYDVAEQSFPVP